MDSSYVSCALGSAEKQTRLARRNEQNAESWLFPSYPNLGVSPTKPFTAHDSASSCSRRCLAHNSLKTTGGPFRPFRILVQTRDSRET